jgi:hypothetical protein
LKVNLTPEQCCGTRVMIGLSQADTEAAAHVTKKTIADFRQVATHSHLRSWREAAREGDPLMQPECLANG